MKNPFEGIKKFAPDHPREIKPSFLDRLSRRQLLKNFVPSKTRVKFLRFVSSMKKKKKKLNLIRSSSKNKNKILFNERIQKSRINRTNRKNFGPRNKLSLDHVLPAKDKSLIKK